MLYPVLQDPLHPIVSSLFDRPRGASIGQMLFGAGEQGGWYDVSDMSTLFQDAAGTTPVTAVEQPVGLMLDKSGRGNHALQATTTKRPVLSARYNLIISTGGLGLNAIQYTCTPSTDAPAGIAGSVKITATGVAGVPTQQFTSTGVAYKYTVYAKNGAGAGFAVLLRNNTASVNYIPSVVSLDNGWSLHTIEPPAIPAGNLIMVYFGRTGSSLAGDFWFIAEPKVTLATDAHFPYQRVTTATDYDADPSKFPAYLRFDGVDDGATSPTGGGGTAGFFYSSAITVAGGAGTARTLFSDTGANTGYIVRINAGNQLELAAGNGTAYTTVASAAALTAPTSAVVQAWDDGINLNVRIGSGPVASVARPAVSAGTAGFTVGQDNGASSGYFNGRICSTVYRKDSAPTLAQRDAVAAYQRLQARFA